MIQNNALSLIYFLVTAFVIVPVHINAKCNLCNENGISCVNETSFNICIDGQPKIGKLFTCPAKKLCSDTSLKCVDIESGGQAACEPHKGCGICTADKTFACTSRTTFVQCDGQKLTKNIGICPKGLVCDSQGGEICKNECSRPDILECDIDAAL